MTNVQSSRLGMYLTVRDYCILNASLLTNLPNFSPNQTTLQNTILSIQNVGEQQKIDKKGGTVGKKQFAANLVTIAADNARKLSAYAKFTNNPTLQGEVHITEGSFRNFSDSDLKDYAQIIYDRAQTNVAALASYGITAATQTAFLAAINAYNASLSTPRVNTTVTSQATKQLVLLFDTADAALENMDASVEIIRLTQPNFYNGYRTARKIVNTSVSTFAFKAKVTDAQTGAPLANVTLTFIPVSNTGTLKAASTSNGKASIVKKTANGGGLNVKNMPDGTYQVEIEKPGFKKQIVTINIVNGEMFVLEVALEKA